MSPLLKKEIRLLLPAWGVALLLAAISPWLFQYTSTVVGGCVVAIIGAVILASSPFGREFALGTAATMLVQPVPRWNFMAVKFALLGFGILSVLAVSWCSYVARSEALIGDPGWHYYAMSDEQVTFQKQMIRQEYWQVLRIGGVIAATIFAGGLWTALVFRQMVASFWVTILVPGLLAATTSLLLKWLKMEAAGAAVFAMLILYVVGSMGWSWRLFLRVEDTPFSWGSQTLPSFGELVGRRHEPRAHGTKRAMHTLIRQELSLHQTSLVAAAILLVLNLVAMAVQTWGGFERNSTLASILEMHGFIWLLIPLFLGASAIAEERRHGTLQAHLSLPVSRWRLFLTKFSVVAMLGMLLGAGGLLLTEVLGRQMGLSGFSGTNGIGWRSVLGLLLGSVGLGFVGFYASSLSRTSLQSVGIAIIVSIVALFSVEFIARGDLNGLVPTAWIPILYWSTLIAATAWLSYQNFGHLHCGLNRAIQNAGILLLTVTVVTTVSAGIYWRAWELVMPLEGRHGPPRIDGAARAEIVDTWRGKRFTVRLPDGRLWVSDQDEQVRRGGNHYWVPIRGRFLSSSNWIAVASSLEEAVGLRSDGSLWSLVRAEYRNEHWEVVQNHPRQVGVDTNWSAIAAGARNLLALKADGTLWGWGPNEHYELLNDSKPLTNGPVQITRNSGWVAVFARRYGSTVVVKRDGTTWQWGEIRELTPSGSSGDVTYTEPTLWKIDLRNLRQFGGDGQWDFLLYEDGTLWLVRQTFNGTILGTLTQSGYATEPVRVGEVQKWKSFAESGLPYDVLAISSDGSLWRSRESWRRSRVSLASRYNDWIAVGQYRGAYVALAADGTLTFWDAFERSEALIPSRRPLASINIFDEAE